MKIEPINDFFHINIHKTFGSERNDCVLSFSLSLSLISLGLSPFSLTLHHCSYNQNPHQFFFFLLQFDLDFCFLLWVYLVFLN